MYKETSLGAKEYADTIFEKGVNDLDVNTFENNIKANEKKLGANRLRGYIKDIAKISNKDIVDSVISNNKFIREKLVTNNRIYKNDFKNFIDIYRIVHKNFISQGEIYVTELFYLFTLPGIYYTTDSKVDIQIKKNEFLIRRSSNTENLHKLIFVYYDGNVDGIVFKQPIEYDSNINGYSLRDYPKEYSNSLIELIINEINKIFPNLKPYDLPDYWSSKYKQNAGYFNKYLKYKTKYLLLKYN